MSGEPNIHQVITGALNKGENVFAVGSVEGINFTACAVGCDVVILASDFQRVQIIPGVFQDTHKNVQISCIDCCSDTGKIAAAYGDIIKTFEPTPLVRHSTTHRLDYRWFDTQTIQTGGGFVSHLSFNLEGKRLLATSGARMQLYEQRAISTSVDFSIAEEPQIAIGEHQKGDSEWVCAWSTELSSPVRYLKFSPDGQLFASAGANDRAVKVWYEETDVSSHRGLHFNFTYLCHPRAVRGFEWRNTSRYMPRHCCASVLISWCRDNISRIWTETVLSYDVAANMDLESGELQTDFAGGAHTLFSARSKRYEYRNKVKTAKKKFSGKLKQLSHMTSRGRKKASLPPSISGQNLTIGGSVPGRSRSPFDTQACSSAPGVSATPATLHFHLAASINAETDCFLVPSMSSTTKEATFAVHWLNNKALMFSLGAEKVLAEALLAAVAAQQNVTEGAVGSVPPSRERSPLPDLHTELTTAKPSGLSVQSSVDSYDALATNTVAGDSNKTVGGSTTATIPPSVISADSQHSSEGDRDMLDYRLEALLRRWHTSCDILFTIHPIDGSLLVWTLEWLDQDSSRQPTISFSSRFPGALPVTDAVSLQQNLVTFNPHDPIFVHALHAADYDEGVANGTNRSSAGASGSMSHRQDTNTMFLLTNHENGSLNLWHLSMDEKSQFQTILNIQHKSRMCGHRFRIRHVVCHPVLPLLLTTGRHRKRLLSTADDITRSSSVERNRRAVQNATSPLASPTAPRFRSLSAEGRHVCTEQQESLFRSEMILWKVNPVGPLCKSGGVRELARISRVEPTAFDNIAWVPAIFPSSTLGSVCDSPSSCFVANDGHQLRLFQAVIDGRALLGEINASNKRNRRTSSSSGGESSPEMTDKHHRQQQRSPAKRNAGDVFQVVSTQSTARPGCVIQLPAIHDTRRPWNKIIFLHVYHELMLSESDTLEQNGLANLATVLGVSNNQLLTSPTSVTTPSSRCGNAVIDHSKSDAFHERFYLVALERAHHVDASADTAAPPLLHIWSIDIASQPTNSPDSGAIQNGRISSTDPVFLPTAPKVAPSVSHLYVSSKKVYSGPLSLPPGVGVWRASTAVGHLSSSSLYPACRAPYQFTTACTDDQVRFWCIKSEGAVCEEWRMVSQTRDSAIELEGRIVGLSNAHSSRVACAYEPVDGRPQHRQQLHSDDAQQETMRIQIAVFECESTGGIEWVQEDLIRLDNVLIPKLEPLQMEEFSFHASNSPVDVVINDWQNRPDLHATAARIPRITSIPKALEMKRVVSDHQLRRSTSKIALGAGMANVVHIDWVSTEDGSHLLTVAVGARLHFYSQVSEDMAQRNITVMRESELQRRPVLRKASSVAAQNLPRKNFVKWVELRSVSLQSADGLLPAATTLSWVRDGVLVVGMESEMRVYNQWNMTGSADNSTDAKKRRRQLPIGINVVSDAKKDVPLMVDRLALPTQTKLSLHISPSHSVLDGLSSKKMPSHSTKLQLRPGQALSASKDWKSSTQSVDSKGQSSSTVVDKGEALVEIVREEGLFEAAHLTSPMLPQYHPKQLMELLNAGKMRRVKAILIHVLSCIRDRNVVLPHGAGSSLKCRGSVSGGSARDDSSAIQRRPSLVGGGDESGTLDYAEIESIPPLALHLLIAADSLADDRAPTAGSTSAANVGGQKKEQKYDDLFTVTNGVGGAPSPLHGDGGENATDKETLSDEEDDDEEQEVSDHGRLGGDAHFTAKHTRMLTRYLTHVHLPGLSSVDQMHLLAVADTLSHFSPDVMDKLRLANAVIGEGGAVSVSASMGVAGGYATLGSGVDTVDECGLRFLMAMKQHEYLLRDL